MAKTYIDIVKYMIEAKFNISGSVEKPDIIGAIFGQTEGLLGSDLDLRELQKNGKIGRIEIDSGSQGNKTYGKLLLPSSLGRVETCILAAAIESVDRVGPFETNFKIEKIEDTRNEKRTHVINRAKELVKNLMENVIPDSREISDLVESEVKSSTVVFYGADNLPAGPDINKNEDLIIVEGRADVVNLLRSDIANCIAIGGATGNIPKTILNLCSQKEGTLFLDGDHGGDMILKGITNMAEVDYVARAPDGKEVEELTRKEIIKALRSRVPIDQVLSGQKYNSRQNNHTTVQQPSIEQTDTHKDYRESQNIDRGEREKQASSYQQRNPRQRQRRYESERTDMPSPSEISSRMYGRQREEYKEQKIEAPQEQTTRQYESKPNIPHISSDSEEPANIDKIEFSEVKHMPSPSEKYTLALTELKNTLRGRLFSEDGKVISEIPIRELILTIQDHKDIKSIVFDGIITQRLVELAYKQGVREIYGIRASQLTKRYDDMLLYAGESGVV